MQTDKLKLIDTILKYTKLAADCTNVDSLKMHYEIINTCALELKRIETTEKEGK